MTIGEIIKAKDKKTYDKLMKLANSNKKGSLYLCDAEKNINCKKKSCYLNGGPCTQTIDAKFEKAKLENGGG